MPNSGAESSANSFDTHYGPVLPNGRKWQPYLHFNPGFWHDAPAKVGVNVSAPWKSNPTVMPESRADPQGYFFGAQHDHFAANDTKWRQFCLLDPGFGHDTRKKLVDHLSIQTVPGPKNYEICFQHSRAFRTICSMSWFPKAGQIGHFVDNYSSLCPTWGTKL